MGFSSCCITSQPQILSSKQHNLFFLAVLWIRTWTVLSGAAGLSPVPSASPWGPRSNPRSPHPGPPNGIGKARCLDPHEDLA